MVVQICRCSQVIFSLFRFVHAHTHTQGKIGETLLSSAEVEMRRTVLLPISDGQNSEQSKAVQKGNGLSVITT